MNEQTEWINYEQGNEWMNKSMANLIIKSHVHATVQHDVASSHADQDAASAHIC